MKARQTRAIPPSHNDFYEKGKRVLWDFPNFADFVRILGFHHKPDFPPISPLTKIKTFLHAFFLNNLDSVNTLGLG